jgi:cellulose 1,4-beta-cellobiosidase
VLLASIGTTPPCTPPATPTGLTATGAKKSVKLAWTGVTGATSYKVYYAQGGKYTLRATVTGTSYTDSGLLAGQTYRYAITAATACESGYSAGACAVPTR